MSPILVVDDGRGLRLALRNMLERAGLQVAEAEDGEQALKWIAKEGTPRAILLDWDMPRLDGLTFLRRLRADPAHASCPLIMLIRENQFNRISMALEAGADEVLMKPFDRTLLSGKLASVGVERKAISVCGSR